MLTLSIALCLVVLLCLQCQSVSTLAGEGLSSKLTTGKARPSISILAARARSRDAPFDKPARSDPRAPPQSREREREREQERELVDIYTSSVSKRTTVAVLAALSMSLLAHFLSNILFSTSSMTISAASGLLCALFVFLPGDLGNFSRSLGVFSLILLMRARPLKLARRISRQLLGVVAERRPFPPGPSPWRYRPQDDEEDLEFSMTSTLLTVCLTAGWLGWNLAKPIPLLPSWLLGLVTLAISGFWATRQDTLGDMLRLYGYLVHRGLSELGTTADEVQLRARTSVLFSSVFSVLRSIDDQFQVMDYVHYIVSEIVSFLTSLILRSKGLSTDRPRQEARTSDERHYSRPARR